ncbi:RagB/SusD family nutrient uptake outer membrane protein [Chitinophaga eiseniae]|uniref:RagB/SusD family nutrient uptake outer membrane protein n=1 Tax=Chitinophaga eiseniae TaxID=634771 RepID=A0A847SHW7_9BACT|nr:RagB/SusD family nutrient uptake outer membrane protein [Chitinophaga eiseniae]NLR81431.1 RagB/SusD family nutrient uptake outer membrane protein [Chitinophaga eiseniae]
MQIILSITQTLTKTAIVLLALIICLFEISCKKLIKVDNPTTSISGENVFTNSQTAAALLTGIYTQMSSSAITIGDLTSIGFFTGLSGDELTLYSGANNPDLEAYYQNKIIASSMGSANSIWVNIYPKLFTVNSVIENVPKATELSESVKNQLLGEAKFMRAFFYFYLVNLYGDVPLVLSTNYTVNNVLVRSAKSDVWAQIISDLNDAKSLLSGDYLNSALTGKTTERVRPNKWAAIALLSRCYLYTHKWKSAEDQATEIINNSSVYHLDSLNNVFLSNNWEAIWQLQPVNIASNTEDAKTYVLHSTGLSFLKPVYLSNQIVNSFEDNDQRKNRWINSIDISGQTYYYANKYKSDSINAPLTEYHTVLRLGEQFLIRAEARAQQNNLQGSLDDINVIRKRAWLEDFKTNNSVQILSEIYHQRQLELFTEWGHRWLDMKRLQTVDSIMAIVTPIKGGTWSSNWQLYPIPPLDILADGNIIQNPGY